ncbi:hypothetical protein [Shinella pollutisoli]|uniref:Uncharacterized protein n=1 Tax=Shinella pollutisoli TaxID=2250594 RepID=A0ABV7DA97_9HYPH|nr:hypothetical protein [Shinella pollutisoli]
MPDIDDHDAEWRERPQDDPRYVAAAKAAREAYLAAHPPVDCWIDSVQTIDLYLEGRHRARVFPRKARADIFDENGNTTATVTYLRSETAFGAVEGHLRVGHIAEVRDDSNEGGGEISRFLRKQAEKDAANFRSACPPPDEAAHYLQEAIRASKSFGGEEIPAARKWRDLIGDALDAIAANDRAAAHGIVLTALSGMDEDALFDWQMAWVDCARAAEALRRDLEKAGGESRG